MRVRGDAAQDLLTLAVNRWNFSMPTRAYWTLEEAHRVNPPRNMTAGHDPAIPRGRPETALPQYGNGIEDLDALVKPARRAGQKVQTPHHIVQIGQTVGNPTLAATNVATAQSDAWNLVRSAIGNARKFIYIEDQYFWSEDAARELAKALPKIQHLTVLVPPDDLVGASLRHRAIDVLYDAAGSDEQRKKIAFFIRKDSYHQYIHAKMYIVDDEIVIVGSANCNNRGYFHDSEVVGLVADPPWDDEHGPRDGKWYKLELNLAHKLRMQLWAEHLRIDASRVVDGVAAAVYWRDPPPDVKASRNLVEYPYSPQPLVATRLHQVYLPGGWLDFAVIDPKP
jgi:phosphatidylserine/phosphatidylglycerophosphate/cardiolipin synthase-like enzyme